MYKVYAKNGDDILCIHNDVSTSKDDKLSNPKLTLTENAAGQFDAKVPSTNVGYDHLERVYTEIIVERQGTEIWSGRIISVKEDFYKNKTITCEGEMAYLNDTIQPQEPYEDTDTNTVLDALLQIHNQKVDERKQITLGYTTINGDISSSYTNYNSTLEAINDLVIKPFGGIIEVKRNNNGELKLNYFSEDDRSPSSQTINFGENLLDFTKSYDSTDFCTVVLPLGARIQDKYGISTSGIDGVEAYVTIEEVNDGSPYLANLDTLETYGRIEKTIQYSEIEDPEELMAAATLYLTSQQFDKMVIEINAVDLGYLNVNAGNINLSENVRVISRPHGLDRFFPVTKISIPLDNPANTTFTMGGTVTSLTTKGVSGIGGLSDLIEKIPTKSDILDAAKRRADDLINAFTTGYITITTDENGSNELFVTDTQITTKEDVFEHCNRYWRWNLNGLGYYNKNSATYGNPNGLKLALTMDGEIVADFITAGTLTAEIIKAGILKGHDNNDNWWDMKTGELHIGSTAKYGNDNITIERKFEITKEGVLSTVSNTYLTKSSASTTYDTITSVNSKIQQSASGILTEVSNSYETINGSNSKKASLESKIAQTAVQIASSVTASGKWYDPGNYTISLSGVGDPNTLKDEYGNYLYPASSYAYQYYMDISNGYIYYSNWYNWSYVARGTAQSGSMTSMIKQTASEISLKVTADDVTNMISASASGIRLQGGSIVVESPNFSVDENGTMSCSNATISGNITVGGKNNGYGSIDVRNSSDSTVLKLNNDGIKNSSGELWLSSDGYISCTGLEVTQNATRVKELDILTGPVYAFSGTDVYTGYTGLVGYRAQNNDRTNMRFVNGILVEKDVHT